MFFKWDLLRGDHAASRVEPCHDGACRHRAGGRSVSEGIVAMRTCRSSTAVIRDFICGLVSPASRPSILAVTR